MGGRERGIGDSVEILLGRACRRFCFCGLRRLLCLFLLAGMDQSLCFLKARQGAQGHLGHEFIHGGGFLPELAGKVKVVAVPVAHVCEAPPSILNLKFSGRFSPPSSLTTFFTTLIVPVPTNVF